MGDEHDGLTALVEAGQQPHHLAGSLAVQAARGFVGQQQGRMVDQRPGQGDALLFAAGQLTGHAASLARQAQLGQQPLALGARLLGGDPGEQGGQLHVVGDRQVGDQVEELEDDADAPSPLHRPARLAVRVRAFGVQPDAAGVGPLEAAEEMQQRRLAGAGRPGDGDELALAHGKIHSAHGIRRGALAVVGLDQALGAQQGA